MSETFSGCSSLLELNLSNFNTDNVFYMSNIFYLCSNELVNKIREKYKNIFIKNY